jgi:hypothetical protein
MGVGIEYLKNNQFTEKAGFVKPGSCRTEDLEDYGVKLVFVSSLEENKGTVYAIGDTGKVSLDLFQNDEDETGSLAKTSPLIIEKYEEKIGLFVNVENQQELLINIKGKGKGKRKKEMCVFICKTPEEMAENLIDQL